MSIYKVIDATIFDPKDHPFKSVRNEKASCSIILCNNAENCDLYKKNQCVRINLFGEPCPHGKNLKEEGFTKNAKAYQSWINERKEKYADVLRKLKHAEDIMAVVGDYIYLPYSHADMNKNVPFLRHDLYLLPGIKLVKKEDFNLNTIKNIISFRPQAMMGGEITSYQNEIVPKFILHLSEVFPELYNELIKEMPELTITKENVNYVGRKALLATVKVGSTFTHHKGQSYEEKWTWDGEYMNYKGNKLSFAITEFDSVEIKLKPKANAIITIEDNEQVTKETKFVN